MIGALVAAVFAVILVVSLFVRRHGESASAHATWSATEERFRDPSTGRDRKFELMSHTNAVPCTSGTYENSVP